MQRHYVSIVFLLSLAIAPTSALADAGLVRLSETAGPYRVTLLTNPTPLYAGPVEISVYVQDAHTLAPVTDAAVELRLLQLSESTAVPEPSNANSHSSETISLLPSPLAGEGPGVRGPHYAGRGHLPRAGRWEMRLQIQSPTGDATAACTVEAAPPPPRWTTMWPWISLPAAVMLLYALREYTQTTRQHARDAITISDHQTEGTPR